ncbi:MAG TPA: UDP-N-acetylmuramoyl-tripeptide--D-alanyl-D-alanine ligase [Spirochaetaceae bacterium]|nr:UDP-N-acetylmuramoyl-tripeptide--D-alanyl-D-alanine ligase [Spirochaetaceae bacterium]
MIEASRRILFTSGEAVGMIGGACKGNLQAVIDNVVVDSRKASAGSLFIALPGENADGHDYIGAALARGAACILAATDRKEKLLSSLPPSGFGRSCIIFVDSPLSGLQGLAREHRRRMKNLLRIGVTGSSGKTTTKECIAAALAPAFPSGSLVMNEGNLNSDIGLALAMFTLEPFHKVGVFEMGMNRKGEMDELVSIYEPDIAIITNIGTAHIGMIGSRDGIAAEKKRIFSRFDGRQIGFVWEDDSYREFLEAGVKGKMAEFGYRATEGLEEYSSLGLAGWKLRWSGQTILFPLPGRHNLLDALAALSVAAELKLAPALVAAGLASVKPLFGRSEIFEGRISLVRDCYNANPDSVAAAIDLCDSVESRGRKVYVLGSMRELGDTSVEEHEAIGMKASLSKAEGLFFFGEEARASFEAAQSASCSAGGDAGSGRMIFHTNDIESLKSAVLSYLKDGDLVLVKASRGLALERFTEALFAEGWVNPALLTQEDREKEGAIHAS